MRYLIGYSVKWKLHLEQNIIHFTHSFLYDRGECNLVLSEDSYMEELEKAAYENAKQEIIKEGMPKYYPGLVRILAISRWFC